MSDLNDQFYHQVSESIKLVFDLTSRIDERVKMLVEQHNEATQRIERLLDRQENIQARLSVLEEKSGTNTVKDDINDIRRQMQTMEIKLASLQQMNVGHENKWKMMADFLFKIGVAVITGILAWKLTK